MKKMSIAAAGLALTLGIAGVAAAQAPEQRPPREQRQQRERGGQVERGARRMGGEGMLLKGITLTDAQKSRIAELRKNEANKDSREQFRKAMDDVRAARQRGDTAAARATMQSLRTQMEARREQHLTALRGVLTSEQQKQFDANVAEWKKRAQEREARGERGEHGGRGARAEHGQHRGS